jgi:hypothetical protein
MSALVSGMSQAWWESVVRFGISESRWSPQQFPSFPQLFRFLRIETEDVREVGKGVKSTSVAQKERCGEEERLHPEFSRLMSKLLACQREAKLRMRSCKFQTWLKAERRRQRPGQGVVVQVRRMELGAKRVPQSVRKSA